MTVEAEIARKIGYRMEVKKHALSQLQDGSVKVTFTIHPQEVDQRLYADLMGQRYVAVIVPLNDDDTPKVSGGHASQQTAAPEAPIPPAPFSKWSELKYVVRAGILAENEDFMAYAALQKFDDAAEYIRDVCGVQSRREIDINPKSREAFDRMHNSFTHWRDYERSAA
ncbi:MAG: hypothetical protein DI551_08725 [Micavibrio aeruginosavorus]|uniref:Uncharacterized protein n=1 Tax=Micavibrio aeruginosavorus TaxID=349221 RepID=A0A2W5PKA2_9BACT|nr:MAG: hypothetical protein DI551_08725 [Micavibrio aeruginosavorus]